MEQRSMDYIVGEEPGISVTLSLFSTKRFLKLNLLPTIFSVVHNFLICMAAS